MTRRRLGASLAQRVNEALAIRIIHDDQFAPVTIIHDVRQQTRLSICGPCQESGFGRYTYQHQEPHSDPEAASHLPRRQQLKIVDLLEPFVREHGNGNGH